MRQVIELEDGQLEEIIIGLDKIEALVTGLRGENATLRAQLVDAVETLNTIKNDKQANAEFLHAVARNCLARIEGGSAMTQYNYNALVTEIQRRWEPAQIQIKPPETEDEKKRFIEACVSIGIDVEQFKEIANASIY